MSTPLIVGAWNKRQRFKSQSNPIAILNEKWLDGSSIVVYERKEMTWLVSLTVSSWWWLPWIDVPCLGLEKVSSPSRIPTPFFDCGRSLAFLLCWSSSFVFGPELLNARRYRCTRVFIFRNCLCVNDRLSSCFAFNWKDVHQIKWNQPASMIFASFGMFAYL